MKYDEAISRVAALEYCSRAKIACNERPVGRQRPRTDLSLRVILCVFRDEFLFIRRNLVDHEDRIGRTDRDASSTVDAAVWIYVKLGSSFERLFVLLRVNAVRRTRFDAKFVFRA